MAADVVYRVHTRIQPTVQLSASVKPILLPRIDLPCLEHDYSMKQAVNAVELRHSLVGPTPYSISAHIANLQFTAWKELTSTRQVWWLPINCPGLHPFSVAFQLWTVTSASTACTKTSALG